MAAFLAVLAVALQQGLAGDTKWDALGAEARMRLGFELHTRRALMGGELPLWNPYHAAGRPHLADASTLAVYPPHVALRFLPIDTFFVASFVLHAAVFGVGAYLVGRQLGASRMPSVLASASVMLATILLPRPDLALSSSVYSTAWLPLIVALSLRSAGSSRAWPHAGLVAAAVMALTGAPPGRVYAIAAIACCYLYTAVWPERGAGRKALLTQAALLVGLSVGLSAFQLVPGLRLMATTAMAGGLARDDLRVRPAPEEAFRGERRLIMVLASSVDGHRTLSHCDEALDPSRVLPLGIPGVDAYGGTFLADYGRFANIALGSTEEPSRAPAALAASLRTDLLRFLNVGHLVSCSPVDVTRWNVVAEIDGASVAQARVSAPRAFWTCAPRRVSREELDYRLRHYRYDDTLTLRDAEPVITIRWAASLDPQARRGVETDLNIRPRMFIDGRTWQYDLLDSSRANLVRLVNHPSVEDTGGFDRGSLSLPPPSDPPSFEGPASEWLLGVDSCDELRAATIAQVDRADGHVDLMVDAPRDGLVFLSETYFADRTAHVDGTRVDPIKVNLAFTGIPVTAGVHRIELRASATSFWLGSGFTAMTAVFWGVGAWRTRVTRLAGPTASNAGKRIKFSIGQGGS
jgi:hypothetical protein